MKRKKGRPKKVEGVVAEDLSGKKYLTVGEAAKILRIHEQTLYKSLEKGDAPRHRRVGGAIRFYAEDL